ncbi:hypothetical protein [Pseudomonas guariconensis]|uniref:hypothetical protein n=1 Tax=Pseudomonas guariconensis TaxID=1288410 RepID=UPI002FE5301B
MNCPTHTKAQQKGSSPASIKTLSSDTAANPSVPCDASTEHIQTTNDDRSINISFGNFPTTENQKTQSSTLEISDKKTYTVKVENDTDWPAVIASLIVGAAIAWFAMKSQQNQTKANVANFRHDWQNNLRTKISEFISKVALIHFRLNSDPQFLNKPDSDHIFSELIFIQSNIELLLDSKKNSSLELTRTMEEIVQKLKDGEDSLEALLNSLNRQANEVLEKAWQTIRKDLGVKRTGERHRFRFWRNDQSPT